MTKLSVKNIYNTYSAIHYDVGVSRTCLTQGFFQSSSEKVIKIGLNEILYS